MIEIIMKEILQTGNIYIIIIAILAITLFFFVKYFFSDKKKENNKNKHSMLNLSENFTKEIKSLTDGIIVSDNSFYENIKEIQKGLKVINENIDKLYDEQKDKMKDMEHTQDKMSEKINENHEIVKQMKDDVMSLKYKVELMLVQTNNSTLINKGL